HDLSSADAGRIAAPRTIECWRTPLYRAQSAIRGKRERRAHRGRLCAKGGSCEWTLCCDREKPGVHAGSLAARSRRPAWQTSFRHHARRRDLMDLRSPAQRPIDFITSLKIGFARNIHRVTSKT